MFMTTHKIVAQQTLAQLSRSNYPLDKRCFIWGNMIPDIAPNLIAKPHYLNESLNYIVKSTLSLCCLPASILDIPMKRRYVSAQIGIICHFLSDFFTLPHSQRLKLDSISATSKHLKYETLLQHKASQGSFSQLNLSEENISSFVMQLQAQYQLREDYMNDLRYSVKISSIISALIVQTIQENAPLNSYEKVEAAIL
ncbi:zinc dependent phospholipase C family protein [Desulfitobacterium metallireducens]|uniref:Phospholipase C/D domain-containing protein n=1 Tax=Desulfitobacterium metallireducens DSM 15288 TaxID=871968 RepID=W0ECQ1_9FIRM|nr:zinc dependent phospholipase C family protein [Desulfitobacterium metallireducens]AHF08542.1 hypothetical protein DESME_08025 [Desulfitobacterium metallireducens DSM 15288]